MKVKITGNELNDGTIYHFLEVGKTYYASNECENTEVGLCRKICGYLVLEEDFEIVED